MPCWLLTWIPVLTPLLAFGISVAALCYLVRYTNLTKGIEQASQRQAEASREQAEASQKPVIVLHCIPRLDHGDVIMEQLAQKHVPQASKVAVSSPHGFFIIKNIGTGPALNVSFDFVPLGSNDSGGSEVSRYARRYPYVLEDDDLEATIGPELVAQNDYRFTAKYQSLSGKWYSTEMVLRARSAQLAIVREDWIFKAL